MATPNIINIDVAAPDQLPKALREAAQSYRQSASDLEAAWQDHHAGRVWIKLAAILERAAAAADKAIAAA